MFNIIVTIQALLQFIHARIRARGRARHPHVKVSLRQNLAVKVVHLEKLNGICRFCKFLF